jgi:fumarylacetoacetate (FAA) hydrolase
MTPPLTYGQITDNSEPMKLATLKSSQSRDGALIVVSHDCQRAVRVAHDIASSLREAIENWSVTKPKLEKVYLDLNAGRVQAAFQVNPNELHSPLPRSFQWADGSAFLHHVKLVRQARKAPIPETLFTVPLMYQGGSDTFLAPTEDIPQVDFSHGTDFEAEVAVVVSDVPMGVTPEKALDHIILFMIVNDVSLRGLIPEELAAGFGFFQSKPSSAFGPFAVTADELGSAWRGGRIHLPLLVNYNGQFFGRANSGEMHFHFGQLIAHAARTRSLAAGTIIGSGTVSNEDPQVGSSCLVEKRMIETIRDGQPKTSFMRVGDTIEIKMLNEKGEDIFGRISQKVSKA